MAKCELFGSCGGCASQNVDYPEQVKAKAEALKSACGVEPQVFFGSELGYRNRMDFVFHPAGLGLRRKGRWDKIVDVVSCPIAEQSVNAILAQAREFFAGCDVFDPHSKMGTFRYAVIRVGSTSSICFVVNSDSSALDDARSLVGRYAKVSNADNVLMVRVGPNTDVSFGSDVEVFKGEAFLESVLCGKRFRYSSQGFFQNNAAMAEKMLRYVAALVDGESGTLLDLYSGVGTFGIICGGPFDEVLMVEEFESSVKACEQNLSLNRTEGRVVMIDARKLAKLGLAQGLVVICDPPRQGMHPDTISELRRLRPRKLVYVCCNVANLARDIALLDMEVVSAALFDFFPQTPHSEAVVELRVRTPQKP